MVENHLWTSFEAWYLVTQIFVALGTVFLSVFSAMVTYKTYRDNNVENWLHMEFSFLIDNTRNGITSLCMNLRNSGRVPIKVSNAVVFFLGNTKILENVAFGYKEVQEIDVMDMRPICLEPVRIRNTNGDIKNNAFDVLDFYFDKIEDLDIDKIKRVRIGIVSNVKYHKFDLSDEEVFAMLRYLKEFKENIEENKEKLLAERTEK
ncbi:MAG: hypothetical protein PHE89_04455 [Alphaproteobacteria bacterium]|nr:hypothetical protein [Alphaproteobacteria bacterium]